MNKNDFILIGCVCALCLGVWGFGFFQKKEPTLVQITVDGVPYQTADLKTDCEISINGTNTVVIQDGAVYMAQANCPDGLCVKQGKLHTRGGSIVCLPNRVVVSLSDNGEIDAIVG